MSERWGDYPHPEVVIFCEDGHKRRKVQTYRMNENGSDGVWAPVKIASRRERASGAARYSRSSTASADIGGTRAHLVDDVPGPARRWVVAKAESDVNGAVIEARLRDALTCSSCNMRVPVRDERLQVVLTKLWEAGGAESSGVSYLSLKGLGAVV